MRESSSLHQKVQEMCDCYATNDPLKEMSRLQHQPDVDEAAIKWIALAILHGLNNNAEEISLEKTKSGSVRVVAEYRKTELPPPDNDIGDRIVAVLRDIIHVDSSQGESTLAFGFRNNSMELRLKTREEAGGRKITIGFP
ncbi:hypothetical protein [Desulforhopalus singaporensis]|uniref:Uncharacterized protein n=1 Tax=Desulforhopalus singaporensis TaxID=91360 RepID=A0A1H0LVH6_9BACT|nr:hypothetical protein [Desulforhopalus singaporensis]SDO72198.1 hypothetical protein SAMN05660330_00873 [Desulforhopalus singaporensis]